MNNCWNKNVIHFFSFFKLQVTVETPDPDTLSTPEVGMKRWVIKVDEKMIKS